MTAAPEYRVVPFDAGAGHRDGFTSGSEPLDRYFREQLSQDIKRRVTSAFVALSIVSGMTVGYYTLASASVDLSDLPEAVRKKLPRYPTVPAVRMGRLAVHSDVQGQGIGALLLVDGLKRAYRSEVASYALLVDAKNEKAADYYRRFNFTAFEKDPLLLFLPLATVKELMIPARTAGK